MITTATYRRRIDPNARPAFITPMKVQPNNNIHTTPTYVGGKCAQREHPLAEILFASGGGGGANLRSPFANSRHHLDGICIFHSV